MTPLFHPHLVNGPLGDPALYIDFKFDKRALLFDLGEIRSLSPRKLLKVSHVFISHTHMDHFIGFDHLLRVCLGRDKVIHLFGPPNFLDHLKNKIAAYTWNLVETYSSPLELIVGEVHPDHIISARLSSSSGFKIETDRETRPFNGCLYEEMSLMVRAAFLDHKIPCLGFALEEKSHLNIIKTELDKMGLSKGPWLRVLKEAVWKGEEDDFTIQGYEKGSGQAHRFPLGVLRERLIKIAPGQKIAYIVDTVLNDATQKAIEQLVNEADTLFIETAFLEEDGKRAQEKYHLTARQAGTLAAKAGVKRLIPFHFSPKYSTNPERVVAEALAAFQENRR
ncbi:MAG: ribonuclease Z [Deltaproteobacteria bacterium]|nr:ribonuclease Z [Deltaproteobacteria bacterium]